MGLGDFLSDILNTGVQNLPAIVSAVRGPTSPQAMSFAPATAAAGGLLGAGNVFERALGLAPGGGGATGLPQGYAPALFRPSATQRGATPKRRIEVMAGGRLYAFQYLGRPILYSGDRGVAKRWARITGHTLGRRGAARVRRRRPR